MAPLEWGFKGWVGGAAVALLGGVAEEKRQPRQQAEEERGFGIEQREGDHSSVYGPVRLGILTVLQMEGSQDFTMLKMRLDVVDGGIAIHLRKLEDVGYLTCSKPFVGRRPKSAYRINPQGRRALHHCLNAMQQVIEAVKKQAPQSAESRQREAGRPPPSTAGVRRPVLRDASKQIR